MTPEQKLAIKCAYADLAGAYQAVKRDMNASNHDWDAHKLSIEELEELFSFIEPVSID